MKEIFFHSIGKISALFPTSLLTKISQTKIICPFYHTIEPNYPPLLKHLYKPISFTRWMSDINFFTKHFEPLTPESFYELIKTQKQPKKQSFFLSFDDGLREVYEKAFPVLKEKGIKAAIFVNTDFIDNKDLFYRYQVSLIIENIEKQPTLQKLIEPILSDFTDLKGKSVKEKLLNISSKEKHVLNKLLPICELDLNSILKEQKPYLTWDELLELANEGWFIGSHGTNHDEFQSLDYNERIEQINKSVCEIENHIQQNIKMFAFPFTDFNIEQHFIEMLHKNLNIDITFGGAGINKEKSPFHVQRIPMEKNYSTSASSMIKSEFFYYLAKSMVGKKYIQR